MRGASAFSEAIADHGGISISHVAGAHGDGDATTDSNGKAVTNVTAGGEAHSTADGHCLATAKADGTGSKATANCVGTLTFAHATATGGGLAKAFDNASPTCTANGGTAKVVSSGGNCSKP